VLRVVFVCTGNTCRSPVAAALLHKRLINDVDWVVTSAGIRATDGELAAPYSIQLMAERGIDLSNHRSHAFDFSLIGPSTLVLCMEQAQVDWIKKHHTGRCENIFTLSEMSNRLMDVIDPYGGTLEMYRQMVSDLIMLIDTGFPCIMDFQSLKY